MSNGKILCVDDEPKILLTLKKMLECEGYMVLTAASGEEALRILESESCDVAIVDYRMPGMSGIELLKQIKMSKIDVEPIILTAYGDTRLIVQAIKNGAIDYLLKPWDPAALLGAIEKVFNYRNHLAQKNTWSDVSMQTGRYGNLIGVSPKMKRLYAIIEQIANSEDTVLILGESGTGKELVAKAIHENGNRSSQPFIPVDCNVINQQVIESELFGHVKGAFTGAIHSKEGLFKSAGSGTIFLDEIADIPPSIQGKLLRALQEKVIRPVGSTQSVDIAARVIAATNKELEMAMKEGAFREDLFYRLQVISMYLPPLRERREDIPLLMEHFIEKYNTDAREIKSISPEALNLLQKYDWPGNIRELENFVRRIFTLGKGERIDAHDIPEEFIRQIKEETYADRSLAEVEKDHIKKTITHFNGNIREAAKALGMGKSTLYNKIREYKIDL